MPGPPAAAGLRHAGSVRRGGAARKAGRQQPPDEDDRQADLQDALQFPDHVPERVGQGEGRGEGPHQVDERDDTHGDPERGQETAFGRRRPPEPQPDRQQEQQRQDGPRALVEGRRRCERGPAREGSWLPRAAGTAGRAGVEHQQDHDIQYGGAGPYQADHDPVERRPQPAGRVGQGDLREDRRTRPLADADAEQRQHGHFEVSPVAEVAHEHVGDHEGTDRVPRAAVERDDPRPGT